MVMVRIPLTKPTSVATSVAQQLQLANKPAPSAGLPAFLAMSSFILSALLVATIFRGRGGWQGLDHLCHCDIFGFGVLHVQLPAVLFIVLFLSSCMVRKQALTMLKYLT